MVGGLGAAFLLLRNPAGGTIAVEVKRRGDIDGVEQLTRYLELLNRDPRLAPVRGIFAAQQIKPQARTLAADLGSGQGAQAYLRELAFRDFYADVLFHWPHSLWHNWNRQFDGIDLDIGAGQFTAIMGPSGSGKSTLMHCLAGLDSVTSGQVFIGEQEITGLKDKALTRLRRDRIGFIFQAFNLIPTLTARENITLPALLGPALTYLLAAEGRFGPLLLLLALLSLAAGGLMMLGAARGDTIVAQPSLVRPRSSASSGEISQNISGCSSARYGRRRDIAPEVYISVRR